MKVIVSGATGFLGGHLVDELTKQGHQVIALGRNKQKGERLNSTACQFRQVDLTEFDDVLSVMEEADCVIHCAALSSAWGEHRQFYNHNVLATKHLFLSAEIFDVSRFVYVSSTSVYFNYKDGENITEQHPVARPFANRYAETKFLGEQVVMRAERKIESIVIRPRGIIGEGDEAIMPRVLKAANNQRFPLFRKGEAKVDITYVKNVVDALILAMETPNINGEIFNISNDEPIQVKELLERVFSIMKMPVKWMALPYPLVDTAIRIQDIFCQTFGIKEPTFTRYSLGLLARTQTLNISKAKAVLGYSPRYTLDQGIERYVEWYQGVEK